MKQLIRLSCLRCLDQANKVCALFLSDKCYLLLGVFLCQSISLVSSYFVLSPPQNFFTHDYYVIQACIMKQQPNTWMNFHILVNRSLKFCTDVMISTSSCYLSKKSFRALNYSPPKWKSSCKMELIYIYVWGLLTIKPWATVLKCPLPF